MKKTAANAKVNRAIQRGRLSRPSACGQCGRLGRVVAHHVDYDKPFDIQWLCYSCHMKTHRVIWRQMAEAGISMSMPSLEKIERNKSVIETHLAHPDWTRKEIAGIYKISPGRVFEIIQREEDRNRVFLVATGY